MNHTWALSPFFQFSLPWAPAVTLFLCGWPAITFSCAPRDRWDTLCTGKLGCLTTDEVNIKKSKHDVWTTSQRAKTTSDPWNTDARRLSLLKLACHPWMTTFKAQVATQPGTCWHMYVLGWALFLLTCTNQTCCFLCRVLQAPMKPHAYCKVAAPD